MINFRTILLIVLCPILIFQNCKIPKNSLNSENGWVITKIATDKPDYGMGLLFLTVHDAENTIDTIYNAVFIVNGIDLPTRDSSVNFHVFLGRYRIKAALLGFIPLETTVNKKKAGDIHVDFYLKGEIIY